MRLLFATFFFALATLSWAQEKDFLFQQYRVKNGLPSDIIKAVSQDSLGFFWIATDDGLVKYDGIQFTQYKSALQRQHVNGLLLTRSKKLVAIGDLDLIEIINRVDTVIFKSLLKGAGNLTDSTINYPNSIYEDKQGNIWLGESQSIIRYSGNEKLTRFDLDKRPTRCMFFETSNGDFYTLTYQGDLYQFDKKSSFKKIDIQLPELIRHIEFSNNALVMATDKGLFKLGFTEGSLNALQVLVPSINASHFLFTKDSSLWLSSTANELFFQKHRKNSSLKKLSSVYNNVNHIYESQEGDIWISTDKGLVLLQENQFKTVDPLYRTDYIGDLAFDGNRNKLYYCSRDAIVAVSQANSGGFSAAILNEAPNNFYQCLKFGKQGLWISQNFKVQVYNNNRVVKKWDFSDKGDFVQDIFIDKAGNTWLCQAENKNVMMVDPQYAIHEYNVPIIDRTDISLIREGNKGMYAASSGSKDYLFLKQPGETSFKNISLPLDFNLERDFMVNDMAVQGNILWLATSEGLLRYDHRTVTRIDLGDLMTNAGVTAVELVDEENILFANTFGLLGYNVKRNEFWLFDESSGLPSNTISLGGILIDKYKRVWIGTSLGLAFTPKSISNPSKTRMPFCVEALVNGVKHSFSDKIVAPYDSYLNLTFSPITFPENKIILQWKYEKDSVWRSLKTTQLTISNPPVGDNVIQVRAKKNTGASWSDPREIHIIIGKPFWQTINFILLIVLAGLLLVWLTVLIYSYFSKRRARKLENLIKERTSELQVANDELLVRNTELDRFVYSVSHDLSAPLKSILGLITVVRMEPSANYGEYFERMEKSVRKLEEFIKEVVSYSRNARMPLRIEKIDFKSFVNSILQDHQFTSDFNKIKFIVTDNSSIPFKTDGTRLKVILNNLISNSIKFHRYNDAEQPFVDISLTVVNGEFFVQVEDNGIGIEESHCSHIFEMFYRAEESAQGSGLGLYILKETVTKLRGTVQVKSKLTKGTTFIIKLPIIDLMDEGSQII